MVTAYIRHKVVDYDAWKVGYDGAEGIRQQAGVTGASVSKDTTDSNYVIITHDFNDMESAQGFMNSPDLKAAMEAAGVSDVTVWFGTPV